MKTNQKEALLNRSLFVQRAFDSGAITVLTTLIHRFEESGDYELFVRSAGRTAARLMVRVVDSDAAYQHNLDLTDLQAKERECCHQDADVLLHAGGVLGLYASKGSASFQVEVQRIGAKDKQVLLNNAEQVPDGDFFVVTPLQSGVYRVSDSLNKAEMLLRVAMPPLPGAVKKPAAGKEKKGRQERDYRPDQPSLVETGKGGFGRKEISLYSGQALVIQCKQAARLRVEMQKPDKPASKPPKSIRRGKSTAS
ncbi:MAG TPA: hypothetical protein VLH85_00670 [Levilinea sp.]|nr:hypothetical protein [Levilinea sp.]